MEYTEFICAVQQEMSQRMKGDVKVTAYTAVKNNDIQRRGIVLETPGINISPTIYLEEFYESYRKGRPLEKIVDEVAAFYQSIRQEKSWNYERILHFEGVKDRIVFKLINTGRNRALLETVPHREVLDLSLVFYVLLEMNSEGTAVMLVGNSHMEQWEIDMEMLWSAAVENSKRLLPAEFFTMNHAMQELLGTVPEAKRAEGNLLLGNNPERDRMYVLSNRIRNYGAACIVYPYVLEMIGNILAEDFYVLPSSVHEVVIVPSSGNIRYRELSDMVHEINVTQVPEEEILSDHAYYYECGNRTLSIKGESRRKKEAQR